jgi:hypothetical protein
MKGIIWIMAGAVAAGSLIDARAKADNFVHKDAHGFLPCAFTTSASAFVPGDALVYNTITGEPRRAAFERPAPKTGIFELI